ncbi:MAG: zinc ribbon domain-containing protein [Oscillospiraceae bacterium]|nr:zinc ribbon domain-containing protein [Oscillospiraceae bacterium]
MKKPQQITERLLRQTEEPKLVFCAECGEEFRRIHWNNRGKKSIVWRCLTRLDHKGECHARTVNEEILKAEGRCFGI